MARGSVTRLVSPKTNRVSWRARWSFIDPSGVRRHRTESCATRKAAEAALTKAQHDLRSGTYIEPSPKPLGEYMTAWFVRMRHHWGRESTYYDRHATWERYGIPTLEMVALRDLTLARIQQVIDGLATRGLSRGTILSFQVMLKMALDDAVAHGLIPRNPVTGTKLPAASMTAPHHWSPEEATQFLAAVADDPDVALWSLMLYTGLRIGEALALRWQDVDLQKGTARIVRTITRDADGREIIAEGTKTDASRRTIPLMPDLCTVLKRHRVTQNERRLAHGQGWQDLDLVFSGQDGRKRKREAIRLRLARLCTVNDLQVLSPHGLRHTAATIALANGTHPKLVQELLGHKTIAMTLDLYSHSVEGLQRDAAERIADALTTPLEPDNTTTSADETG